MSNLLFVVRVQILQRWGYLGDDHLFLFLWERWFIHEQCAVKAPAHVLHDYTNVALLNHCTKHLHGIRVIKSGKNAHLFRETIEEFPWNMLVQQLLEGYWSAVPLSSVHFAKTTPAYWLFVHIQLTIRNNLSWSAIRQSRNICWGPVDTIPSPGFFHSLPLQNEHSTFVLWSAGVRESKAAQSINQILECVLVDEFLHRASLTHHVRSKRFSHAAQLSVVWIIHVASLTTATRRRGPHCACAWTCGTHHACS